MANNMPEAYQGIATFWLGFRVRGRVPGLAGALVPSILSGKQTVGSHVGVVREDRGGSKGVLEKLVTGEKTLD